VHKKLVVPDHIVVEAMGTETLALHPDGHVWHLSGHAAEVVRRASNGGVEDDSPGVAELVAQGLLAPTSTLNRRHVITGGVAAAGLALSSLALPSVALASSGVHLLKGLLFNSSGKVGFTLTSEFVAAGDAPTDWFPEPKPSSNLSEVSGLTVGDVVVPVDQDSSYVGQQQSNSLTWISDIDFASSASTYTGTFTWSGHRFSVEFVTIT
jgi:hypothetical protein